MFRSNTFMTAMKKFGIKLSFTCPYNPQENGRVERLNGSLKGIIKKYTDKAQLNWDRFLSRAIYVYNNSQHGTTKYTQYELLYGRTNRSPLNTNESKEYGFEDFDPDRILARQLADENIEHAMKITKYYYDRVHKPTEFKVGDGILVRIGTLPRKLTRKLCHKYVGPFKIVRMIGKEDHPQCIIYRDNSGNFS